MESAKISEVEKPGRRSKKVKNLEEEVELILSQDENDENSDADMETKEIVHTTPSKPKNTHHIVATPKDSQAVLEDFLQTPRRSCRKSIKPAQEYEDIVNKSLRFSRSARKHLVIVEDKENEDLESETLPKWNPAKVGRVSQKRGRKSKRAGKGKKQDNTQTAQLIETIFDIESGKTKKTVDILENEENLDEKIIEQNDIALVESVGKQMQFDDSIVEVRENSRPITAEVQVENLNTTFESHEVENIIERNDTDQKENDTKQMIFDDIEEVNENSEPIATGVQVENLNRTFESKEIEQESSIIHNNTENKTDKENKEDQEPDTDEMDSDSIHLIQDDSEDCNKFTDKSEQEEICIIYESNISNREINKIQIGSPKRSVQGKKDSFGSYLKSKEINISDLGLNPLKDEAEDKDFYCSKSAFDGAEEMPSLIVCDELQNIESNKLNETFEANERDTKRNEDAMETLQLSDDDGERPKKRVRIAQAETEPKNHFILSTPTGSTSKVKLSSTPKPFATSKLSSTPKQSTKPFRFPTPYRSNKSFKFDDAKENIKTAPKNSAKASTIFLTTLEPKEIVLRGIRKRSLSICIANYNVDRKKEERMVSFYSPANETAIIDDIDMLIASSVKKPKSQVKPSNKFVTTRRKRSISLDESVMPTSLASKLPRPLPGQNLAAKTHASSSSSKTQMRTKLPNFAAIHEKQFKKMENLLEHVNRKQERSKNLINSSTKIKPDSTQKTSSVVKNSSNIPNANSKALKKIDMSQIKSLNTTQLAETKDARELPVPRLGATKLIKSGSTSHKPPHHQQQNIKCLKPSQTSNIEKPQSNIKMLAPSKPTFNLSTSLMTKSMPSSSQSNERGNISHMMSHDDKMTSRLQRHMDLFKGRAPSTRQAGTATRKNEVILKGVRSNRRFELQMKHRKNLEQ